MRDDLRQAVRFLWRRRGVTAIAATTLAVGIGATTLIFGVADAAIFKPLPYLEPSRLVDFYHVYWRGTAEEMRAIGIGFDEAIAWRAQESVLDRVEMFSSGRPRLMTGGATPEPVAVGRLSPGMFSMLGISPHIGRPFLDEEAIDGRDRVVLLSDAYFARRFGSDASVVGRALQFDGVPYVVIGVMPARARFRPFANADAWVPVTSAASRDRCCSAIARLRPGLSLEQANAEIAPVARRVAQHLGRKEDFDVELYRFDSHRSADEIRGTVLLILGASALLLAIACANVGNMLLALSVARRREVAVRRALGASRARIVRQAFAEGLLLACIGAAAGLLLTLWGVRAAPALVPAELRLFEVHELSVDARVILFAVALAAVTGVLASVVSVTRSEDSDASDLQGRTTGSTPARGRARSLLLGGQVALTFVLLIGAGLLAMSLIRMMRLDTGFNAERLAYASVALPERRYPTRAQRDAFFDDLLARVRQIPGIESAALGSPPPDAPFASAVVAEGTELQEGRRGGAELHYVGVDYFTSPASRFARDARSTRRTRRTSRRSPSSAREPRACTGLATRRLASAFAAARWARGLPWSALRRT